MNTPQFETKIQEIKYRVLKETARLYRNRQLVNSYSEIPKLIVPGPLPSMRCCIYKERAIVSERVHMATGGTLRDPNIVEVIDIACDECPVGGYEITDICRGCIAHKCENACGRDAIYFDRSQKAHIDKTKCVECGRCASVCPYTAIINYKRPCERSCKSKAISMDANKKAIISHSKCISCGSCITQCPFGAIVDKSFLLDVIDIIRKSIGNTVYKTHAILAPSVSAWFKPVSAGKISSALRLLGFGYVHDVAEGADLVAEAEAEEWVKRYKKGDFTFMTTSCCPAFAGYVRTQYPKYAGNISETPSPMEMLASKIKENDPSARVVFIGPCIGKKTEQKSGNSCVDSVITFEELRAFIDSYDIDYDMLIDDNYSKASEHGKGFARSGGASAAVAHYLEVTGNPLRKEFRPAVCSGLDECRNALLKAGHGNNINFIEGMSCPGGCSGDK